MSLAPLLSTSAHVHDDMDLSFRVQAGEYVLFSTAVRVRMSPRALKLGPQTIRRVRRAFSTLRNNWVMKSPATRWTSRRRKVRQMQALVVTQARSDE